MQLTLCVHAEQKSNQQNISSCVVIFTVLKDYNFLKTLRRLIQINSKLNEKDQVNTLLHGSQTNDSKCANQEILKFVIAYIKTTTCTTRFYRSLISNQMKIIFLLTCLVNWLCICIFVFG